MEWEEWLQGPRNQVGKKFHPTHKNGIKQLSIMFQLPYWEVGVHMLFFYCRIMPMVVQTMNYHVILLQELEIIVKTLIIFKS
jgi:hypothetical protein